MLYAQVIVKKKTQVEELSYSVPARIIPYIRVGSLVSVPLRHKNVKAVVVKFVRSVPHELKDKIREILSIDKKTLPLTEERIRVIEELALKTGSTVAEIAFHALPTTAKTLQVQPEGQAFRFGMRKVIVIQGTLCWRCEQYRKLLAKYGEKRNFVFVFAKGQFADAFKASNASENGRAIVSTLRDIFAPLNRGDFLVVDQPYHAGSTFSQRPYLSARQIAAIRGEVEGINVIFGDNLLPIEDYPQVQRGFWKLLAQKTVLKPLFVSDRRGSRELIMPSVLQRLEKLIANGERGLALVMSRGWAQALVCGECGYVFTCDNCGRTSSLNAEKLQCRYCATVRDWPKACPKCRSAILRAVGEGVSQFANLLQKAFPGARVAMLSADAPEIDLKADILVATEKIFSFPDVNFDESFILSADRPLSGAKLGGIGDLLGHALELQANSKRVSVQTYSPDHPVWGFASTGKFNSYYEMGLENRRLLRLPPFGSVITFVGFGRHTESLLKEATGIGEKLSKVLSNVEISFAEITDRTGQNYRAEFTVLLPTRPSPKTLHLIRAQLPMSWSPRLF
ncbi:hypothetical protein A3A71_02975 [Candidatus Berkelbacteria bacterium RIFCSPLOWO2_01_FULL_50_28]|uniref:Primosomal protein N' 3' DNA-binding domain-containing protein n=1 Tax=Candidatus Berkelbacteria bacterium RIFCSPLOWO2_01_FULL_50_28 TaxID=1797471 RepID=A0A1F5ECA1_9BACT|nr:MAG: hypothetical protein A2807_02510 [Candidatus Berkelbacteria bacterium RIFCSPHIGHO2_01_FULL_50_36]OGD62672.1 MAG: hypothetical protein A3F39_00525 [Candidatus Berkelbacteria bacterium RIFCSPHIGHO2_12_FULL_50_11]OGD64981.1 MAG: hypothetical protein A3A71_02975 [Candidatus Berkelbacteria bacterium RIFCSPLOWO2_01_FULL_50_28]